MSTPTADQHSPETLSRRKAKHLEICVRKELYSVESGDAGFGQYKFPHRALPELCFDEVDTSTTFLGIPVFMPLFISCMTGGSAEGHKANRELALAAQEARIPVGMGSHRILFRDPEVFPHFHLRPFAPDVPIISNIGGVQIRDLDHRLVIEMNKKLEVDAQVIHLNPAQELFQPDGDRDFRGIRDAIGRFIDGSPIPVIVKETGCGLSPAETLDLIDLGATYIDVAGTGGTSWILVEASRGGSDELSEAEEFQGWGWPTAAVLEQLKKHPATKGKVLASGGLRTASDLAKSLALGASLGGMALPFIRSVVEGGKDRVLEHIQEIQRTLKRIMLLTGSPNVQILSQLRLLQAHGGGLA